MKTHRLQRRRPAFTLIELLVVITIIALLVGIALPAVQGVMNNARKVQTVNAITGLATAVSNYYSDYNRLPVGPGAKQDSEVDLTPGTPLLKVLLGENVDRLNPGARPYLESPQIGKGGTGGLIASGDSFSFVDNWGQPYRVLLDSNYDGSIANPDLKNADTAIAKDAIPKLPRKVAVYSAGPDKQFGTKDDITSWR